MVLKRIHTGSHCSIGCVMNFINAVTAVFLASLAVSEPAGIFSTVTKVQSDIGQSVLGTVGQIVKGVLSNGQGNAASGGTSVPIKGGSSTPVVGSTPTSTSNSSQYMSNTSTSGSNAQPGFSNTIPTGCSSAPGDDANQVYIDSNPVCGTRQLQTLYQWPVLTYSTPPGYEADPSYDPSIAIITGIVATEETLYLSTPRSSSILPSTLNTVPTSASSSSPDLQPYPDLSWNQFDRNSPDCDSSLISVHRSSKDRCNRLWVLDSGQLYTSEFDYENICPPKFVIFDMSTNEMVRLVPIPDSVLKTKSRLQDLAIDDVILSPGTSETTASTTSSPCDNSFVYIADTTVPAIITYNVRNNSFHRITHPYMYPDPNVPSYTVGGQNVTVFYGILGMVIGESQGNRYLFFAPFSSNYTFKIPTSTLQQPPNYKDRSELPVTRAFRKLGPGIALIMDRSDGCILYNPISDGTIVGWNPEVQTQSVLARDTSLLTLAKAFSQTFDNNLITYVVQGPLIAHEEAYDNGESNNSVLILTQED